MGGGPPSPKPTAHGHSPPSFPRAPSRAPLWSTLEFKVGLSVWALPPSVLELKAQLISSWVQLLPFTQSPFATSSSLT